VRDVLAPGVPPSSYCCVFSRNPGRRSRDPQDLMESSKTRLENLLPQQAELWCVPQYCRERGDVAEKIREVAKRRKTDRIVLGCARRLACREPPSIRQLGRRMRLFLRHIATRRHLVAPPPANAHRIQSHYWASLRHKARNASPVCSLVECECAPYQFSPYPPSAF
jgi:hypothetical protein